MNRVLICLLFSAMLAEGGQDSLPATNSLPVESSIAALTNTPVRMVEPGIYEIGKVRLDQRKRSITLSAVLDKSQGFMEYFLVTAYGKTHESILQTEAKPYDIHLAMLLLGANGPGNAEFPGSPTNGVPGPVIHPSADVIPGNKVSIAVKWAVAGTKIEHAAEELIFKHDAQAVMQRGAWVYNGSLIVHNRFLAQVDGSIVSLVTDPVALVNNTGPGHDNDLIWEPNQTNLPPRDLPVEVIITLQDPPVKP